MVLIDKNNREIQPGIYHGKGSPSCGIIYIAGIKTVPDDLGFVEIQGIGGFHMGYASELAELQRVDDPLEFVKRIEFLYSPSNSVVIFMKSLIWDLAKNKIPKDQLEAILAES